MAWPKARRVEYYRHIAEKRSPEAAQRLVETIRKLSGAGSAASFTAG
jgi:plasmid stabilization system protein ParE